MEKIDKDKLIKKEMQKLNKFFKHIPKDKQELIRGLKEQAAFMYATLMELQEIIVAPGLRAGRGLKRFQAQICPGSIE